MRRLLMVWITLLTWGFYPWFSEPFLLPRDMVFYVGLWACVLQALFMPVTALARWKNPYLRPFLLWTLCFNGWVFWWHLLAKTPTDTVAFNWYAVLPTVTALCMGIAVYLLATRAFVHFPDVVAVTRWTCYLGVSVAAYAIVQYFGYDQFFHEPGVVSFTNPAVPSTWMLTTMGNVSYVAMFLAPLTPLYLIFREKRFLVMLLIVLLSLWLMHKSYGLLGAGVALTSFGWLRLYHRFPRWKWGWVSLVPLGMALSGCSLWHWQTVLTQDWRWSIWRLMNEGLKHRVLTGFGMGGFAQQFFFNWESVRNQLPAGFPGSRWMWAHNDLWQLAHEGGVISVGLAAGVAWSVLQRSFQRSKHIVVAAYLASMLGILVVSLMNFPWHFAPSAACILVGWAILECEPEGGWV